MALLVELVEQVEQRLHLRGFLLEILGIDEAGVTTDLPQAHETLEDGEGILLHRLVGIES